MPVSSCLITIKHNSVQDINYSLFNRTIYKTDDSSIAILRLYAFILCLTLKGNRGLQIQWKANKYDDVRWFVTRKENIICQQAKFYNNSTQ